ncbi:MAG: bifunctional phosphopantothenoylcysteine decarboxylase/phosphopantothenate--cysteine ligase CoaBC [Rhizobiales bacterium]|nr:bifunctional phosphopantothenoylcysteine decarboxylase/phosphopantothenate--cysteine ligase CoaBC [Hyphomicrobiales bacterium]NRB15317.1 bifunctional phosphopantothenoylcysteine decarboxylase/phosphopantothenate--cysteine ligase CoaBC [Hyphomicrobiales bacterium]
MSVQGKNILLVITGGIAAYKSLELIRLIRKSGGHVTAVMTKASKQFVTPLSVAALTENKIYDDLFNLTDEAEMGHISLSRENDLILVMPATANILAKMAHGIADDLATTLLLATDSRVMVAPAMNVRMWEHKATQHNVDILKQRKVIFVGPEEGDMACGEYGYGRLAEPMDILTALNQFFAPQDQILRGKHVLITAGPTHEPIDPVRFLGNISSGKQGYALATAARDAGANVTLITGPSTEPVPQNVKLLKVQTAEQMLSAVLNNLPADIAIFAAAVADWKVADYSEQKIKKHADDDDIKTIQFVENPDILKTISKLVSNRPQLVVGFAAETTDVLKNAQAKIKRKECDIMVVNDVSPKTGIMGGDHNSVRIINLNSEEIIDYKTASKDKIAQQLIAYIGGFNK